MRGFQIVFLSLTVLHCGILYMPGFLLRGSRTLSRDKLVEAYPQFAWIRWVYPLLYTLWFLLLFAVSMALIAVSADQLGPQALYFAFLSFPGLAMFDGVFAVRTSIRPVPARGGYSFVYGISTRRMSICQIVLGVVAIAVTSLLALW